MVRNSHPDAGRAALRIAPGLTAEQIAKLRTLCADQLEIEVPVRVGSTGRLRRTFHMRTNDIVLVILTPYSEIS
ncbi:MAG: hypothetical protein JWO04_2197 [Gammaproteobacteria bacterium]|jgi:hypothetical protein|nr:hypothetical protein [Gammaproteobacteria bacterium]